MPTGRAHSRHRYARIVTKVQVKPANQLHKTKQVQACLVAHPTVRLHVTPAYSSWLNQVELWFAEIERDVIARGIFTSKRDLARKLRLYIDRCNQDAKPFRWTYADPTKRIA